MPCDNREAASSQGIVRIASKQKKQERGTEQVLPYSLQKDPALPTLISDIPPPDL
jgi:hypothetical protein